MTRLVTLGESLGIVRSTEPGGFAYTAGGAIGIGGAESNVAIAARRLGIHACWVSRVGDDPLGRRILRELRAEGVEARATIDPGASTGILVKDSPRPGLTDVRYYREGSAASRLSPDDIARAELRAGDLLHVTGITPALSKSARDAVLAAVAEARACGARVSFDINHRSRLWRADQAAPVYRELARAADLVFAGEDEAKLLLGSERSIDSPVSLETLARGIADLGPGEVILKRGADGAASLVYGQWREVAARPVAVIDSVGAGDAFAGAYLAGLLLGFSSAERLDLAAANGAAACEHPGDWEGASTLGDLTRGSSDPVMR